MSSLSDKLISSIGVIKTLSAETLAVNLDLFSFLDLIFLFDNFLFGIKSLFASKELLLLIFSLLLLNILFILLFPVKILLLLMDLLFPNLFALLSNSSIFFIFC